MNEEQKQEIMRDGSLILPLKPPENKNCCVRIMRLIFCCDTKNVGSQANLNDLADGDIELYKKQLI